jgi:hypothetical protein|tara:strand:- start:147 stop:347 length:201 start_codon:yes stop_codon:yes gene_type:complete
MSYAAWEMLFLVSLVAVIFLSGVILGAYLVATRNAKVFKTLTKHLTKAEKDDIVVQATLDNMNENR